MKRYLLVFVFLQGCYLCSFCQKVIPKVGTSLTGVTNLLANSLDYDTLPSLKQGVIAGVAIEFELSKHFSFQPELLYHQKGFKYFFEYPDKPFNTYKELRFKETINYIELPLILKYKVKKMYVEIGGSFGYAISGEYQIRLEEHNGKRSSYGGRVAFKHTKENLFGDDEYYLRQRTEFTSQVGFGVVMLKRFILDFRFAYGLSSYTLKNLEDDRDVKNMSFQTTVGFPIKELVVGYKNR